MKNTKEISAVLKMVQEMSDSEKAAIAEQIMQMMSETQTTGKKGCIELLNPRGNTHPDCPHCGAKAQLGLVKKAGLDHGVQRYKCKSCGRYFYPTTGTAFARTRKDADTWRKFIQLTISGASLRKCQEECGIAYKTANDWRHKILHVFELNLKDTKMTGNVEVDEMLIPLSFKGNHIQGGFGVRKKTDNAINDMPRKAYKRGTDNISRSSKDKSCVFCMVQDGNKGFYAAVPGVGFMTNPMLDATVAKHVDKDKAMVLADNYKVSQNYFETNGYSYTILLSNTSDNPKGHKPEIKDGLHMQHVNAMHHHIRTFLKPYYGVSSKYLSHYIALYIWLKNIRLSKQRKTAEQVSIARVAMPDCYISRNELRSRPAIPQCA